jgi:hypothetical protein
MADLNLDILVIPTYSTKTLAVLDISTYPDSPAVTSPSIEITPPGFDAIEIVFDTEEYNVFNSEDLGITDTGEDLVPIPDGLYTLTYSVTPASENYVTKTIMRVDQLQQEFDKTFMKLDMMECDSAIKKQSKAELNTIFFLIQGSMAAANNCAIETANKLYQQAFKQLSYFNKKNCGCSGTNYIINIT